jgi:hypothetical protein
MYFIEFQHTCLDTLGVDAATLARIDALIKKLAKVINGRGTESRLSDDIGVLYQRLRNCHLWEDERYPRELLENTDEAARLRRVKSQLVRRVELIGVSLTLQDQWRKRAEMLLALAEELANLQVLAEELPADHPLVAYCIGLALLIRRFRVDFDLSTELSKVKDLSLVSALQAVNIIFQDGKVGLRNFEAVRNLQLNLFQLSNPSPAQAELAAALVQLQRSSLDLAIGEHIANSSQVLDWSKEQLTQRLEASMLPPVLRPDWLATATFDEVKRCRDDVVAEFVVSTLIMKSWKGTFDDMRARAENALLQAYAEIQPQNGQYVLLRQFQTQEGIDFYKAMLNCICARHELNRLADLDATYRKMVTDVGDLSLDNRAYIDAALQEARESKALRLDSTR